MNKEKVRDLIITGWNLHQKVERNILNKKRTEKLINEAVEKYLTENEDSNN